MTGEPQGGGQDRETTGHGGLNVDRILLLLALGILTLGTVVYHLLEDWSWVDAFYFSAVAVTTVGFGDLTPSTDAAKIFTVFYIFSGIAIISLFLNERLKRHARQLAKRAQPETD